MNTPVIGSEYLPAWNFSREDANLPEVFDHLEAMGARWMTPPVYAYKRPYIVAWRPNPRHYRDTSLKMHYWDGLGPVDFLDLICREAEKRGIAVYGFFWPFNVLGHLSDRGETVIENWQSARSVDMNGDPGPMMCYANPDYQAHFFGAVRDVFESYPLQGSFFGLDTGGPIAQWQLRGWMPYCFCPHCRRQGLTRGLDAERTITGFRELLNLFGPQRKGGLNHVRGLPHSLENLKVDRPVDGFFTSFFRLLMRYPEILGWNQMWIDQRMHLQKEMYRIIKSIRPEAKVGTHTPSTLFDHFIWAEEDYEIYAGFNDFVRPGVFSSPGGNRFLYSAVVAAATVCGDLDIGQTVNFLSQVLGIPLPGEKWNDLLNNRLDGRFTAAEVRRAKEGVRGRSMVYAGVSASNYQQATEWEQTHEQLVEDLIAAKEAGADGILFGRVDRRGGGFWTREIGVALREAGWL